MWNKTKKFVGKYWMMRPNFFKFPQFRLAISVFVISILLYLHLKGFESWSDIPWRDIRFLTEFILIVLVIPALAYAFGVSYYTSAVITIKHDENNTSYKIGTDGKKYRLGTGKAYIKIYFSRQGDHKVYLYSDNGTVKDGPQTANTYEHHIDYVEFPKENKESKP